MTALLTENLPLLAASPKGIQKLRELILELAVRGKLAPQDPNDEPASELLKRIAKEKPRLVAEGKIKKEKPTHEDLAEISYEIPSTWAVASLGQVVEIVRGITFPASEKSKEPESGRVACLRTANVQDEIEWDDLLYIRESFVSRHDQYVEPHDIVMSMANSRELVGKVAMIGAELKQRTTFGGFLGVLRPVLIEPRFVMVLLRTPHARSTLIDSASQTTNIANVSLGKLRPLPFAIPPLAEQKRIVAKVDELMALCDRLEAQQADAESAHVQFVQALLDSLTQASDAIDFAANWQRLAEHFHTLFTTETSIDALKKTLLQLAVMGKLVPQNPNDEPASELLKRIAEEKARLLAEGKIKKQKEVEGITSENHPYGLPAVWAWTRVGEILIRISNGYTGTQSKIPTENMLSRIETISRAEIDYSRVGYCVQISKEDIEKYSLHEGDILLSHINSDIHLGKTALYKAEKPLIHGTNLLLLRPSSNMSPRYIDLHLTSLRMSGYFLSIAQHAIGQASVNQTKISNIPFGLPPIAEQHRIVARVDELMTLCDQLKYRVTQARQLKEHLASAIIKHAIA